MAPRGWNPETIADTEKRLAAEAAADEWASLHAAVFGAGPGQELLAKYHKLLIEQTAAPTAPEAVLRVQDAQRSLILQIERLTAKGLKLPMR
jgi:hypothetical protein